MTDLTIGQRIAECRKKLGISQEALGERVGVSRQAISKWESDAAMPEIDKLIALSKLFQVSVGWLLGVEEQARQEDTPPQISEELLKKIEQIVLRYQPRKEKLSAKKKWCIAIAAAAVLWLGYTLLDMWNRQDGLLAYVQSEISSINDQNSRIQNQLSNLAAQIDGIHSNVTYANEALASYEFLVTPDLDTNTAQVVLNVIPKTWRDGCSATLSVRTGGELLVSRECAWDGTGYTAKLELPMADGYEYWFVTEDPDGNREQTRLENSTAQNLKSTHSIGCHILSYEDKSIAAIGGTLYLSDYHIYLAMPIATDGTDKWIWTQAEFVLYRVHGSQRTEVNSYSILVGEDGLYHAGTILDPDMTEMWGTCNGSMTLPALAEGDGLELWFRAAVSNGSQTEQKVEAWVYSDSTLVEAE